MAKKFNPYLKKGDFIEIVAPASSCSHEEFLKAIEWLEGQGFKASFEKKLLKPEYYLANSDENRFKYLKKALSSKNIKAVWCLRGGYGSLRLVPSLLKLKKRPAKFFIGLSDITVLHHFLNTKWNWPTIHGPVFVRTGKDNKRSEDYEELFRILQGEQTEVIFKNLKPVNKAALSKKIKLEGRVFGGNLCTYCSILGTSLQPRLKNHFLFFEDSAERGYKVDRMLTQLSQAGVFDNCKGIFFGDFVLSKESDGQDLVPYTIKKFFEKSKIPVYTGVESDHSEKQRPLILNGDAVFEQKANKNQLSVKIKIS